MEVRPGYKQTEVGVVPADWNARPLATVCSMKSGEGITAARINEFATYPCYGGNGIRGYTDRYTHDGHYVLVGRQGALCGNVIGVTGKFFASEHAVVVSPREGTDADYLAYVLGRMNLNRYSESSAQPGLSVSKLLMLPIPTPATTGEQRAIAKALSDADALLAGLDRLIAKKRDIKQAAMQQLLTGQTRLPGFQGEWEVTQLGDVALIKTGGRNNEDKVPDGEYPFFVRSEHVERINTYSHDCEAILVPGEGRIGSIFHYIQGRFDVHQRVYAITQFRPEVSGRFVHLCMSFKFGAWAMQNTVKATVDSLRLPTFQTFVFSLPSTLDEQTAIANVLSDMDAELAALEARRDKTRLLKQGMMQELLTGRTRLV